MSSGNFILDRIEYCGQREYEEAFNEIPERDHIIKNVANNLWQSEKLSRLKSHSPSGKLTKSSVSADNKPMRTLLMIILTLPLAACEQKSPETKTPTAIAIKESCDVSKLSDNLRDPQSIEAAVELINALPKPVDIPCFLKSLKRPLYVSSTSSTISAQPAAGVENPRVFIFKGDLIIAVAPAGDGRDLIEFSEYRSLTRTTKAEVLFPVESDVSKSSVYSRVSTGAQTSCSGCHSNEIEDHEVDGVKVYSSLALRPIDGKEVELEELDKQLYLCQFSKDDSSRCAFFKALLTHGEVKPWEFPSGMPTFFDSFNFN